MKDSVPQSKSTAPNLRRFPQNISSSKTLRGHQDLCVCNDSARLDTLSCQQRAMCANGELGFLLGSALANGTQSLKRISTTEK